VIDPIYIWNNSGNGAYKWRISNGWEANVKQNREIYVNNGAKPGMRSTPTRTPCAATGFPA